jgi:flavin-dependent dehydrogenase
VSIGSAVFSAETAVPVRVPLVNRTETGPERLVVASRRDFDGALLAAAIRHGVALVTERVADVAVDSSGVDVVTARGRERYGFLIGADGVTSLVRRRLRQPFTRHQLSIAVGVFAHGSSSSEIFIELMADPPGYIWSFPRRDHQAIGICAPADGSASAPLRDRVARWTARAGVASGAAVTPYAWPIPSLGEDDFDHEPVAGDRWLLLGDAAGLVDPITREGICYALQSADLAADALVHEAAPGAGYAHRIADLAHPELKRAARLERGFFRAGFVPLLLAGLRQSEAIRGVMADLVAGTQPYRGLKRRLLATLEWSLAWRWVRSGGLASRGML